MHCRFILLLSFSLWTKIHRKEFRSSIKTILKGMKNLEVLALKFKLLLGFPKWAAMVLFWFWWYKKGSARAAVMKWKSAWCSKMKIDIRSWSKSGVAWVSCAALVSLEAINVHRRFSKDYFHESTTGGNAECQSLKPQFVFSRWFSKPKDFYLGGVERYLHWNAI